MHEGTFDRLGGAPFLASLQWLDRSTSAYSAARTAHGKLTLPFHCAPLGQLGIVDGGGGGGGRPGGACPQIDIA